jgi:hypothetical protein
VRGKVHGNAACAHPLGKTGRLSTLQGHENVERGLVEGRGELRVERPAWPDGEKVDDSWIQTHVSRTLVMRRLFRFLSPFRREIFIVIGCYSDWRRRQDRSAEPRIIELS